MVFVDRLSVWWPYYSRKIWGKENWICSCNKLSKITCFALCSIKAWCAAAIEPVHSVCAFPLVLTGMTFTVINICFRRQDRIEKITFADVIFDGARSNNNNSICTLRTHYQFAIVLIEGCLLGVWKSQNNLETKRTAILIQNDLSSIQRRSLPQAPESIVPPLFAWNI